MVAKNSSLKTYTKEEIMGRRGKGELTYKQHEDAVKRKLYEQKKEIERLSSENATLRIKIKAQDKKAEIYNMIIDEAIVDLEDCIGIKRQKP